ncbi:hypothetical protein L1987_58171 [Smallanthus sonchifolius]|uniref:Uncharacterized protein n=1 Tax=Smallanthus sonchifolius TaxID=185202 RepID=A0ACB9DF10_9ASTR|nr:hypothetical protein L1987_58171 [Smallanthus sonchifolius]
MIEEMEVMEAYGGIGGIGGGGGVGGGDDGGQRWVVLAVTVAMATTEVVVVASSFEAKPKLILSVSIYFETDFGKTMRFKRLDVLELDQAKQ